ncbi:hypothetical protein BN1088_1433236 [Sphingobacterium sp. PM2-P1-29]|nr:hypothetical protein BN1088_1433236 [Sphingobacterium sp. PM2-P1-29]
MLSVSTPMDQYIWMKVQIQIRMAVRAVFVSKLIISPYLAVFIS